MLSSIRSAHEYIGFYSSAHVMEHLKDDHMQFAEVRVRKAQFLLSAVNNVGTSPVPALHGHCSAVTSEI